MTEERTENPSIIDITDEEIGKIKNSGQKCFIYTVPIPTVYARYVFRPISYKEYLVVMEDLAKAARAHDARFNEAKVLTPFNDREIAKFLTVQISMVWPSASEVDIHDLPSGDVDSLYQNIMVHSGHFALEAVLSSTEAL